MKNLIAVLIVAIFGIFFSGSLVFAGGFLVYTQDAAATGMGLAYTAQADRPSAVFYNPAGINQLEGTNISAGGSIIIPRTNYRSFSTGQKTEMDHHTYFLPNFFVTHKINDKFAAGFGVFCPFGLSTDWPDDWEGRFISTFAELRTLSLNPVISWQVLPKLSLAAGFNQVFSDVELKRSIDLSPYSPFFGGLPLPEARTRMDGCGQGQGFNLGLLYHITEDINLGMSYRSRVDLHYKGTARFNIPRSGFGPGVDVPLRGLLPDGDASTDVDLPSIFVVGLATTALRDWTFEFDFHWVNWSSMDRLFINFEKPSPPDLNIPRDWHDTFFYSLGAKCQLSESIVLRSGYMFRNTPIPDNTFDPILPDSDQHIVTIGAGYQKGGLGIDLAYMALLYNDRSIRAYDPTTGIPIGGRNGEYESFCSLIGINLQYVF